MMMEWCARCLDSNEETRSVFGDSSLNRLRFMYVLRIIQNEFYRVASPGMSSHPVAAHFGINRLGWVAR